MRGSSLLLFLLLGCFYRRLIRGYARAAPSRFFGRNTGDARSTVAERAEDEEDSSSEERQRGCSSRVRLRVEQYVWCAGGSLSGCGGSRRGCSCLEADLMWRRRKRRLKWGRRRWQVRCRRQRPRRELRHRGSVLRLYTWWRGELRECRRCGGSRRGGVLGRWCDGTDDFALSPRAALVVVADACEGQGVMDTRAVGSERDRQAEAMRVKRRRLGS